MKLTAPYKCDYCDRQKGENNHWWLGLSPDSIGYPLRERAFVLIAWNDAAAEEPNVEHICSESCASKALSKWMAAPR